MKDGMNTLHTVPEGSHVTVFGNNDNNKGQCSFKFQHVYIEHICSNNYLNFPENTKSITSIWVNKTIHQRHLGFHMHSKQLSQH